MATVGRDLIGRGPVAVATDSEVERPEAIDDEMGVIVEVEELTDDVTGVTVASVYFDEITDVPVNVVHEIELGFGGLNIPQNRFNLMLSGITFDSNPNTIILTAAQLNAIRIFNTTGGWGPANGNGISAGFQNQRNNVIPSEERAIITAIMATVGRDLIGRGPVAS